MIDRNHLEDIVKKQHQINKMQAELHNDFLIYKKELFEKARAVLQWKDDNLHTEYLKYRTIGYIKTLRNNCVVLCLPDTDPELNAIYVNVLFDEIYSDEWKQIALEKHNQKIKQDLLDEQEAKGKALLEHELKERAEYERLKAKYEK